MIKQLAFTFARNAVMTVGAGTGAVFGFVFGILAGPILGAGYGAVNGSLIGSTIGLKENKQEQKPTWGEAECKRVAEELTGKSFKPLLLSNPKNGVEFEINCVCKELNLGVEYNGKHHYIYPNEWHKTKDEFEYQQYTDMLKAETCEANGIKLIFVPYNKNIENYLKQEMGSLLGSLKEYKTRN